MKTTAIKTPIVGINDDLFELLAERISSVPEKSVLAVTSKIISYSQGRLVPIKTGSREEKHQLVKQEADRYLPSSYSRYDLMLAVKEHTLTVNAGVDMSNAQGHYVLWPENLQQTTNKIWQFIRQTYRVKEVGVIATDSRTWPLRWGVVGTCLAHCGFSQLTDYRGKQDLFGREITMVHVNVAEAMAAAAALEMGEVAEQTPLCLIENIPQIQFQQRPPTAEELAHLDIKLEDDVYGPFLTSVEWVESR